MCLGSVLHVLRFFCFCFFFFEPKYLTFHVNSARCVLFTDLQKMGPTIPFTYLKIILLQYFSVFSFNFQFPTVSKWTPRFNDLELYYLSTPLLILYSILNRISTRSNLLKKKKKPIMQTDKIILSKFFAKK